MVSKENSKQKYLKKLSEYNILDKIVYNLDVE